MALIGLLLGLIIVAIGYCVILVGDVTLRGVPQADLLVVLIALPFLLAVTNIQSIYQGLRKFREYNAITAAQATLPLPLIGIAVALGGGARAAIVATVVAAVVLFVAVVIVTRRLTRIRWRLNLPYAARWPRTAYAFTRRTCSRTLATGSTCSSSTVSRALRPSASTERAS